MSVGLNSLQRRRKVACQGIRMQAYLDLQGLHGAPAVGHLLGGNPPSMHGLHQGLHHLRGQPRGQIGVVSCL